MILIWGWRVIGRKIDHGTFFCPNCGADRDYTLRGLRNWFTLFWIPIIPLGSKGQAVKCGTCKSMYRPEVLQVPTSGQLSDTVRDGTRAVAVVVLAAGTADPASRAAVIHAARSAGSSSYGDADLDGDLAGAPSPDLAAMVGALAGGLNESGREAFLRQMATVASAGSPSAGQTDVLQQLGVALGLSPMHVTGVLASVGIAGGVAVNPGIPVAPVNAPAARFAAGPPAAWYPDPAGVASGRWWDGRQWTEDVLP